ncbi:hypothetical protein L218DRAFT_949007 [Marasmius fiardii PR-910]|nr:hypothetical protein L218DRAFT_949007 [Marasmius fiardii PR-910]
MPSRPVTQAGGIVANLNETANQSSDKGRDHVNKVFNPVSPFHCQVNNVINSAVNSPDNEEVAQATNLKGNGEAIRELAMKGKEDVAHPLTYANESVDELGGNVAALTEKGKVVEELAVNKTTDAGLLVSEAAVELTGKISSKGELVTEKLESGIGALSHPFAKIQGIFSGLLWTVVVPVGLLVVYGLLRYLHIL